MEEITETVIYDEEEENSGEVLLTEYEGNKSRRHDDMISVQTLVCIIAVLLFLILEFFVPQTADDVFSELKKYTSDTSFTIENPIDIIITYIQKY